MADNPPEGDDIGGLAIGLPPEALLFYIQKADPTATDILNVITATLSEETLTLDSGAPQTFTVNGRQGAWRTGVSMEEAGDVDVLFAGVLVDGDFIIIVIQGAIDAGRDTLIAILGVAEYDYTSPGR